MQITSPAAPGHVLDLRKANIRGKQLFAANDPHQPSEAEFAAADVRRDGPGKGERLARRNDRAALDLQLNGPGSR